MVLYAATAFASAFLLFLVQPLLARYILPWFGGSPGVWTTCLLFFQVLLTAGYGIAHMLARRFSTRRQAAITIGFLLITIVLLPITPSKSWVPDDVSAPTWHILKLLLASIGASYLLLSSTSPLLQSWFSHNRPGASPYPLYTVSNLGSLLAIVSYPLLIEPRLGLNLQTRLWSAFYALFAVLCSACALRLWKAGRTRSTEPAPGQGIDASDLQPPRWRVRAVWLSLTALSSTMLMATTNQLCLDVAVIPLLWLLPMGLYLLSFIICFHSRHWYSRTGYGIVLAAALVLTCIALVQGIHLPLQIQIFSYCLTLFACCMVLHGELVRLKPGPRHLTSFYLMISAGGAVGGIFVSLIAPHVFKAYLEFHIGIAGTAFLFLLILGRDRQSPLFGGRPLWAWGLLSLFFAALIAVLGGHARSALSGNLTVERNFFGILRVLEENREDPAEHRTVLMHGRIEHGYQFSAEDKRYWPTSYFGPNSGLGIAIRFHPRRLDRETRRLRVGVVGLGAGTIASYGEHGDYFRFYEINPAVVEISDRYFTYRKESPATVDVVLGDARISMERERSLDQPGQFDVLAIDAFSSDAIPVHLFTRECYETYWYHLKEDGILALHISSRYFNLSPVIRSLAEQDAVRRPEALLIEDAGSSIQETDATRWVLVTRNRQFTGTPEVKGAVSPWRPDDARRLMFTDDYSNLFRLLR